MTPLEIMTQAEVAFETLNRSAQADEDSANQLEEESLQKRIRAEETRQAAEGVLRDVVISELLRRNLSCCTGCNRVSTDAELRPFLIYGPCKNKGYVHRLCNACATGPYWHTTPKLLESSGEAPLSAGEYVKSGGRTCFPDAEAFHFLTVRHQQVFTQLKAIAEREAETAQSAAAHTPQF
ncbi:MAG: hypothetical protein AAB871_00620 [Patescibacteria group bacterium]